MKCWKLEKRPKFVILGIMAGGLAFSVYHALQENLYVSPNTCDINSKIRDLQVVSG